MIRGNSRPPFTIIPRPRPREKSEELKARLRILEALERKAYDEFVKDITPRKPVDEPFSSYKDQMGFGLHVALTLFTGYLMGYYAFRALFNHSPAMSAAGGILGIGHWHACRDTSLYYQNFESRLKNWLEKPLHSQHRRRRISRLHYKLLILCYY